MRILFVDLQVIFIILIRDFALNYLTYSKICLSVLAVLLMLEWFIEKYM